MSGRGKQRVLVVGGTRGTGLLIACMLPARGYAVRVLARDPVGVRTALGPAFDVIGGDITRADTLPPTLKNIDHVIFTAGTRSGRHAPQRLVKATDFDGVVNTLATARSAGFRGRFVYLNTIGIHTPSLARTLLDLLKRNTFAWRRRVEDEIRSSGLDYTIIRVGFLLDRPARGHAVAISQGNLPLSVRNRIARGDAARIFIDAMEHPRAARATFEIVWSRGAQEDPNARLNALQPDAAR